MSCCKEDPVIIASTNINVHVSGWIVDPRVTIFIKPAPTTNKTVKFFLIDSNGTKVTDEYTTVFERNIERKTYNLGDYINSQRLGRNLIPGLYFIYVEVVEDDYITLIPIFLSDISVSIPQDQEYIYLNHISIVDKITGAMIRLPPQVNVIPVDDRYLVFLYYHKGNKGRLVKLNEYGQAEWDTGYHKFAEVEISLQFSNMRSLLYYMMMRVWNIPPSLISELINYIETGDVVNAIKILKPLYRGFATTLGRTTIEIDTNTATLREKVFVYLGFIDWQKVIGAGALGCAFTTAGAVGLTIATGGVGAISLGLVAKACFAGFVIGAGIGVFMSTDNPGSSSVVKQAENRVTQAKDQIEKETKDAIDLLTLLYQQGRITYEEYQRLLQHLENIKSTAFRTFDELLEDVKNAYREGYEKAREEMKWWIIGAGIGGYVIGLATGD